MDGAIKPRLIRYEDRHGDWGWCCYNLHAQSVGGTLAEAYVLWRDLPPAQLTEIHWHTGDGRAQMRQFARRDQRPPPKPKRDRAAYMRDRRAKLKAGFIGIPYG